MTTACIYSMYTNFHSLVMNIYNEAIQERDIKNNKKLNYSTIKDKNNYNNKKKLNK